LRERCGVRRFFAACLSALIRVELRWPAESNTTSFCTLAAFTGAGFDQLALKLDQAIQHDQRHPALCSSPAGK
jgi:hypothetical protein